MNHQEHEFSVETASLRLDKFVAEKLPELSRSRTQKMIASGQITVNDQKAKASFRLSPGEIVRVKIPFTMSPDIVPLEIPIPIIYEDNDLLVVDKPAGLTVHPAPGYTGPTLLNALMPHLDNFEPLHPRPGIVHRLDKDTSGVMVIARQPAALANVAEQFKKRIVQKVYIALVNGKLEPESGVIEASIGRNTGDRTRMAISSESRGRQARTRYRVDRYIAGNTLIFAMPETGRTHQIRVHLAAIGHPVFGDRVYGQQSRLLGRQFLHAHKLGFYLPSNNEWRVFESPLPSDLLETLKLL